MRYGGREEELLTDGNPTRRLGQIFMTVKGTKLVRIFVILRLWFFELLVSWYQHYLFRLEKTSQIPQIVVEDRR